jgi:bacterioferritin
MSAHNHSDERDRGICPFLSDVTGMRRRARQHMQDCASSTDDNADPATILRLLNEALATELKCVLRYRHHSQLVEGAHAEAAKGEFIKHAQEEQGHADQIAERILQLGGAPNMNPPDTFEEAQSELLEGDNLLDLLEEDLIAERVAIESFEEILQYLGTRDATTRRLFEGILAVEHVRSEELATLRGNMLRGAG